MGKMNEALLSMQEFSTLFRKQFYLQKGKGRSRISMYYPAKHAHFGISTDDWVMMTFIKTAEMYGFSDNEIFMELKVPDYNYKWIRQQLKALMEKCYDTTLLKTIEVKSGLVQNTIFYNLNIKPHGNQNFKICR